MLTNKKQQVSMIDFREFGADNLQFVDITWENLMDGYQHDVSGFASPARPYARKALTIFSFTPNPANTLLFQCMDNSMAHDGVGQNDLVFVDTMFRNHKLADLTGKLIVVILEGFVTLRKVSVNHKGAYVLESQNPMFDSYLVQDFQLEIVGKVVQTLKVFG